MTQAKLQLLVLHPGVGVLLCRFLVLPKGSVVPSWVSPVFWSNYNNMLPKFFGSILCVFVELLHLSHLVSNYTSDIQEELTYYHRGLAIAHDTVLCTPAVLYAQATGP